jgi:hypothetical protein
MGDVDAEGEERFLASLGMTAAVLELKAVF